MSSHSQNIILVYLSCSVDILEIIPHQEFDIDANGVVSEEEAKV